MCFCPEAERLVVWTFGWMKTQLLRIKHKLAALQRSAEELFVHGIKQSMHLFVVMWLIPTCQYFSRRKYWPLSDTKAQIMEMFLVRSCSALSPACGQSWDLWWRSVGCVFVRWTDHDFGLLVGYEAITNSGLLINGASGCAGISFRFCLKFGFWALYPTLAFDRLRSGLLTCLLGSPSGCVLRRRMWCSEVQGEHNVVVCRELFVSWRLKPSCLDFWFLTTAVKTAFFQKIPEHLLFGCSGFSFWINVVCIVWAPDNEPEEKLQTCPHLCLPTRRCVLLCVCPRVCVLQNGHPVFFIRVPGGLELSLCTVGTSSAFLQTADNICLLTCTVTRKTLLTLWISLPPPTLLSPRLQTRSHRFRLPTVDASWKWHVIPNWPHSVSLSILEVALMCFCFLFIFCWNFMGGKSPTSLGSVSWCTFSLTSIIVRVRAVSLSGHSHF